MCFFFQGCVSEPVLSSVGSDSEQTDLGFEYCLGIFV